jgi:hypothetical protein
LDVLDMPLIFSVSKSVMMFFFYDLDFIIMMIIYYCS